METNEVMTNEEIYELKTENGEITETGSNGSLKMAAGLGLGILAGMAICKFTKPVIAKIKARKKSKDVVDLEEEEFEEYDVETEEESDNSGKK